MARNHSTNLKGLILDVVSMGLHFVPTIHIQFGHVSVYLLHVEDANFTDCQISALFKLLSSSRFTRTGLGVDAN